MSEPPIERLSRAQRRRLVAWGLLRALIAAVILVTLYFVIPLDWIDGLSVALALLVAAAILIGVSVWQVLAIIRAGEPGIRAIEALAVIAPLYLLVFAATYFLMAHNDPASFSAELGRMDALYFTVTVFATVGFGDITAVGESARVIVTVQMVLNLILLGAGVRLLTMAVKHGRSEKAGEPPAAAE
ncbi:potassium channel family protein [Microbacterium thalassium]|uniref:potassium channel family protein n=1 Tax=Microbacterium TaxID=33882 RepID=UPI001B7D1264|nr:potassium channel family protein [Microbacterium thalassium]